MTIIISSDEPVEGNPVRNIFISYARADDEPFIEQLHDDLTEHGFDIWWDRQTMQSRGLTFMQELRDAIEGSDRLIAVIGPNAVKSDYIRAEGGHTLLFSRSMIPILREGDYNLIPDELVDFHCPDFRGERPYNENPLKRCFASSQSQFHHLVPSALPFHPCRRISCPAATKSPALGKPYWQTCSDPL